MSRSSVYSTSNSHFAFTSLCSILEKTYAFMFDNLLLLDDVAENAHLSEKNRHYSQKIDLYWKKLSDVLVEIKLYKNNHQHVQTCLRSKHTSHSCKANINEIGSKHNDISLLSDKECSCLFAQLIKCLFKVLLENVTPNANFISTSRFETNTSLLSLRLKRLYGLMEKLGVCTCVRLNDFIVCQKYTNKMLDLSTAASSTIKIENYYFSELLCSSIVFEYLFLLSNDDSRTEESGTSGGEIRLSKNVHAKRKSVFSPLLVDELLVKNSTESDKHILQSLENDEPNTHLFKNFHEILIAYDEKSVLLCKYLSYVLRKYSKFVPINICTKNKVLNSRMVDEEPNEASNEACKYIIVYFILCVRIETELIWLCVTDRKFTLISPWFQNKTTHLRQTFGKSSRHHQSLKNFFFEWFSSTFEKYDLHL